MKSVMTFLVLVVSLVLVTSCSEDADDSPTSVDQNRVETPNSTQPPGDLDPMEDPGDPAGNPVDPSGEDPAEVEESTLAHDLAFLREEEKLARDVYITLYEKWGTNVFNNIAKSEQIHTDSVKDMMATLGIEDPVVDDTVGVFVNVELAQLYADLVAAGMVSEVEGLRVGTTIEDLDMKDIATMIETTDNPEVTTMYQSLYCGSENHMRAFTRQLDRKNETYEVQFITEADYAAVLSDTSGNCD